jgi:hypothetical protein
MGISSEKTIRKTIGGKKEGAARETFKQESSR